MDIVTLTVTQITMASAIKIAMLTEMESVTIIVTQTVINVKEIVIQILMVILIYSVIQIMM